MFLQVHLPEGVGAQGLTAELHRANGRPQEAQLFRRLHRRHAAARGEARPPPYLARSAYPVWAPLAPPVLVRCGHDPPPHTGTAGCARGETEPRCTWWEAQGFAARTAI